MIQNIILDFEDVFINLDKPATAKEMAKYGFLGITPELNTIFKKYEMGLLSTETFLNRTGNIFQNANPQDLINAWNAILLDFPDSRLDFVEALAAENKYRLFLLSNTNEIHMDYVKEQMGMAKFNRFKSSFEVFYLSYEMGKRKPNPDIFEQVLNDNQLNANETLFVDDSKENTDAARQLGMKIWNLIVGKEDITELKAHL